MYNFLLSSSPSLSPFTPAASGGSLARPFSRPPGPRRYLLAAVTYRPASIISHCKAIRVLIMRGPPSGVIHQLVSSTVHMQMQARVRVLRHACRRQVWADTAGRRHNDISSRDAHQWGVTVMADSLSPAVHRINAVKHGTFMCVSPPHWDRIGIRPRSFILIFYGVNVY